MSVLPRRLIEVDLPIGRISAHARREKSIRHGHISTLHIWWARRPLASSRAVLCGVLWPDPADEACPESFVETVAEFATDWAANRRELISEESWDRFNRIAKDPALAGDRLELRGALLDFIADFANWDNSTNEHYLSWARRLTESAHVALGGEPGTRPLVVDPFAGGGSIPLEALRVGADAFASDLNPVAVLLNKVVLEYIPKYGKALADEVRKWGEWVRERAEEELAEFYPPDPDGATPIAYLWARTITCEGPGCGAEVPLIRSLWLAKKSSSDVALAMIPDRQERRVEFGLLQGPSASEVGAGTVRRGSATCPVCGFTTPVESVRKQLKVRNGGTDDARLIAVRQDNPRTLRREFRLPNEKDVEAARTATDRAGEGWLTEWLPSEDTPLGGGSGAGRAFSQRNYGMNQFRDLFTPRQLLALATYGRLITEIPIQSKDLNEAVRVCLALALDRLADFNSSLCVLNSTGGRGVVHTFGRNALPIVWDFMETNPLNDVGANWISGVDAFVDVLQREAVIDTSGVAVQADASHFPLPDDSAHAFVTDPPYYDAVPYSDLSDFFYVWLKRTLPVTVSGPFTDPVTPKDKEAILDEVKKKDHAFYESAMMRSFTAGRRVTRPAGVGLVVFAHKSTAGWEALLQSVVDAGWVVTGSWPIDTERPGRLRAQNSAALASSVHLVVRPRENPDGSLDESSVGDWREVLGELPGRIRAWLPRLAAEGVVGADAIFACLGPALEIFSRFARVEKASGELVTLREYLEHVWAAVSREALSMVFEGADATGFEEDARLTAMFLWTLAAGVDEGGSEVAKAARGGFSLEYDAARKIAQGLGAHLEQMPHVVEVKGESARLLPVRERVRFLFGRGSDVKRAGRRSGGSQGSLFEELAEVDAEPGGVGVSVPSPGETTLDQVHQAMVLFGTNQSDGLRRFLVDAGVGKYGRFWALGQSLAALYPVGSEERRWVEGVLARKTPLGL